MKTAGAINYVRTNERLQGKEGLSSVISDHFNRFEKLSWYAPYRPGCTPSMAFLDAECWLNITKPSDLGAAMRILVHAPGLSYWAGRIKFDRVFGILTKKIAVKI